MLLRFAFLLFSLYNMSLLCVNFNEEKKKIKWKTKERERKSKRSEKKKRRKRYIKKKKTKKREVWRSRREDIHGASRRAHKSAQSARHPRVAALILPGKIHREYKERISSVFCIKSKKKEAFGSKTKEISSLQFTRE